MNTTITVMYNKKKGSFGRGDGKKLPIGCVQGTVHISLNDFITQGKVGYEALHEKLALLAKLHNFDVKPVITVIATSNILRRVYLVRDCNIPSYVVLDIFKLLQEANACTGGSGVLRKTASYVAFLRNVVTVEKTLPSVTSQSAKQRYTLPEDIDGFTAIMLQEELRSIEDGGMNIAATTLDKLRKLFHTKQREERETIPTKKGKRQSDLDLINEAIEEDRVEYSDMPKKKRKKVG